MKRITVYKPAELKCKNPAGFERAHKDWAERLAEYEPWDSREILDSFRAIFRAAGISIGRYSIDTEGGRCDVRIDMGDAGELTGARAVAWLENNLYAALRIPWAGRRRWELAKYGEYYRPGMIPPCPFTGMCYDEDLIDCLNKNVREGMSLQDSFVDLAREAGRLIAAAAEDEVNEDSFIANNEDSLYTWDGTRVN